MSLPLIRELYRHMEWADAMMWTAVLGAPGALQDEQLRRYLEHLHEAQQGFLRVWRAEPREAPYAPLEPLAEFLAQVRACHHTAVAHLDSMGDDGVATVLNVPWASLVERRIGRRPGDTTLADTALQVVLHSTYHRGQVHARLRALGATPPLVDYIAWLWLGRPAPAWP